MCCRTLTAACSRRVAPSLVVNLASASNQITSGGVSCSSTVGSEFEAGCSGPGPLDASQSRIAVRAELM